MWLLQNQEKGLIFRVQPGKVNIVSRKDGDLLLLGDQSISRKHAEISVNSENLADGIVLKDLGSKYGTFVTLGGGELVQLSPNQEVTLNTGEAVRFGIQWNTWRVEYFPLVVATSTLSTAEKIEVKDVVAALGGEMVNDWQPRCTHLTMNKLTVTVKVVCALACGKPIVVPGYWKALKAALASTQTKLPDYKDFVPPLAEALLNPTEVSFTPNAERGKLFSGYTFVAASSKQLNRITPMVTAAGGKAVEFNTRLWTDDKLMDGKTILMQHNPGDKQGSQQSQVCDGYIAAARRLKAAAVRCVPESEVGLAVLYCSMARYCNPRFSPQSLFGASSSQNTQQITVICPNTEDSVKSLQNGVTSAAANTRKRALEDSSEVEQHPSKKTNSEDMFSTQSEEFLDNKNSNAPSTNKPSPRKNQLIVNPSLDMFAPSGQISDQSDLIKNAQTEKSNTSDVMSKPNVNYNPSLDMFAPSGSDRGTRNQINPSCQDIFASHESRQMQKKNGNSVHSDNPSKKLKPTQVEVDDVFSFKKSKNSCNVTKSVGKEDEFTFNSTTKQSKKSLIDQEIIDEFSFVSNKNENQQKPSRLVDDEFSFSSNKSSKKRNRQSNPDLFDSSMECVGDNDRPCGSNSKNHNIANREGDGEEDLFAFDKGPVVKKQKNNNNSSANVDELDAEVVVKILDKNEDSCLNKQNESEQVVFENPPDEKSLITYRKCKPLQVKEESKDEVDELAKELFKSAIVITKPLVVVREKPPDVQLGNSGKNFKKFRKVTGINKRIVPKIIGGSDLVPHQANRENIDDLLPPPRPVSPDDDFCFPGDRKKVKSR